MQGRNEDADTENELIDTLEKGKSGMNSKSSTDIHILPCVKQIAGEKLLLNTANPGAP